VHSRAEAPGKRKPRRVGRYAIFGEIASGGMATVYFGRMEGAVGFAKSVAIKQLHPQFARSPEFVAQLLDEAQLTARIRHPNVVSVLDVVSRSGELFLIMEYVQGESLSRLLRASSRSRLPIPVAIAGAIMGHVLLGLHAAHEATTDRGEPLRIVHRDISPQNVLVGVDGISHILDFGVAKAASRLQNTGENGGIKGKLAYMAPEQLCDAALDRRVDIFAAGVVLWELLAGRRLFARSDPRATIAAVLSGQVPSPSSVRPEVSLALDGLVLRALAAHPDDRFATARDMAIALEGCSPLAGSLSVGNWVETVAGGSLKERALRLREAEECLSINSVSDCESLQRSLALDQRSVSPWSSERATAAGNVADVGSELLSGEWVISGARRRKRAWFLGGGVALVATAVAGLLSGPGKLTQPFARDLGTPTLSAPRTDFAPSASAFATPIASSEDTKTSAYVGTPEPLVPVVPPRPLGARKISTKLRSTRPECSQPYVIDAKGRKRFKPECF
jgi:serine/threonine-protein kinase